MKDRPAMLSDFNTFATRLWNHGIIDDQARLTAIKFPILEGNSDGDIPEKNVIPIDDFHNKPKESEGAEELVKSVFNNFPWADVVEKNSVNLEMVEEGLKPLTDRIKELEEQKQFHLSEIRFEINVRKEQEKKKEAVEMQIPREREVARHLTDRVKELEEQNKKLFDSNRVKQSNFVSWKNAVDRLKEQLKIDKDFIPQYQKETKRLQNQVKQLEKQLKIEKDFITCNYPNLQEIKSYIARALQANDEVARIALVQAMAKSLGLSITPLGEETDV